MSQIVGNAVPYKLGRRVFLVSYVSMGEWQTFGELIYGNEALSILELVYASLHRGDFAVTRKQMRRLTKRRCTAKGLVGLIELICTLSLPELKEDLSVETDSDDSDDERNLKMVYRILSRIHGWTPQEISSMSPAQVYIYLTGGPEGTGIVKMTDSEYQSFLSKRGV